MKDSLDQKHNTVQNIDPNYPQIYYKYTFEATELNPGKINIIKTWQGPKYISSRRPADMTELEAVVLLCWIRKYH